MNDLAKLAEELLVTLDSYSGELVKEWLLEDVHLNAILAALRDAEYWRMGKELRIIDLHDEIEIDAALANAMRKDGEHERR